MAFKGKLWGAYFQQFGEYQPYYKYDDRVWYLMPAQCIQPIAYI